MSYLRSSQSAVRKALCGGGGYHGVNTLAANAAMYVTETVKLGAAAPVLFEVYQPTRTANATGTVSVSGVVKKQQSVASVAGGIAGEIGSYVLGKTLDALWDWFSASAPTHPIIPNAWPPDPTGQPIPVPAPAGVPNPPNWIDWPTPTAPPQTTTSMWEADYPGGPSIAYADDGSDGSDSGGGYDLEM